MTFAPNARPGSGISPVIRTALFWAVTVTFAVLIWRVISGPDLDSSAEAMSYSDFVDQLNKNNVGAAELIESGENAEIHGQLRQPAEKFKVTIPREETAAFTEQLRKQGVVVQVSSLSATKWLAVILNLIPIFAFVSIWRLIAKRERAKRERSASGDLSSRPLG